MNIGIGAVLRLLLFIFLVVPVGCSKTGDNGRDSAPPPGDVAPRLDTIVGDIPHAIDSFDVLVHPDAEVPKTQWVAIGEADDGDLQATSVAVDAKGFVYVTGRFGLPMTFGGITLSPVGGSDIFLARLDPNGKVEWAVSAGGPMDDYPMDVVTDANGGCYVTGGCQQSAVFGPFAVASNGDFDVFVAHFDSAGNVKWAKSYGGPYADHGAGIGADDSGNVYVAGSFKGTAKFDTVTLTATSVFNGFVAKMDGTGNVGWAMPLLSSGHSLVQGIAVDQAGNSDVTGAFQGSLTFATKTFTGNEQYRQAFVGRLDPNGKVLWATSAGNNTSDTLGLYVAADGTGTSYVVGSFAETVSFGSTTLTAQGNHDIFVTKLDANGVYLWAVGAGSSGQDDPGGVAVDGFGGAYATGILGGTGTIGGFQIGSGGQDGLVAKLGGNGKVQWVETATGSGAVPMHRVAADRAGNCYALGGFSGTAVLGGLKFVVMSLKAFFVWKIGAGL